MERESLPVADAITDLRCADKRGLLRDLAHRAAVSLQIAEDVVFSALAKREELGSTGVGSGVAIPHARLAEVQKPFGILARLKEPMDFNAVDGRPVDLVFLLLLPTGEESGQLSALARVARKLRNPQVLQELRSVPNRALLYTAIMRRSAPSKDG